ncbi:unnamed protein product [Cuscuta epithymum]|uniref:Reverse transcriptase n=1 Tax=Cuscuta epithymum TaxID=186058 RepID=A0AAV0DCW7_9ASTE|nr:unnamed protein product [Cuscuta epithymum]
MMRNPSTTNNCKKNRGGTEVEIAGDISALNTLSGQGTPCSLRIWGNVGKKKCLTMIDSGSTHNFIKPSAVEQLQISTQAIQPFKVSVGNGDTLSCQHYCPNVALILQGTTFHIDLHVLPIAGPDIVLGIQWLQGLGTIAHDYSNLTMKFKYEGKLITLKGETTLNPQPVTFAQLETRVPSDEVDTLYVLYQLPPEQPPENKPPQPPGQLALPSHLTDSCKELLLEFSTIFSPPKSLPPKRPFDHHIHLLPNTKPINIRPYRYPHAQKNEMERLVQEMLEQGIIWPSRSPFSSPVLLVRKKDGTYRFCVDYRALNAATVRDNFPIPTADELFDELGGATIFTKLDLRAGYHQIRVRAHDVHKTAFRTHDGHFEFLVMPFGLTNAPATFQAAMNAILAPYLRKFVTVFFDDILIYSRSHEEHLGHLRQVLSCLLYHEFYLKLAKCVFCQESTEYLGHIITKEGVKVDPNKIVAIESWPIPKTVRQLRGFLGLSGYYRRFIKGYATIASPLTDLLQKDKFIWSASATQAFQDLKMAFTTAPVLCLPNFSLKFVVETDASNVGIGAVLMQQDHPISYFSKKIGPKLQTASTYIQELYAITEAVRKWRQYLLGSSFIIRTDHQSLKTLFSHVILTPEQHKYVDKLLGFDFQIEFKPGKDNSAADSLSRIHEHPVCLLLASRPTPEFLDVLRAENQTFNDLRHLHTQLEAGALPSDYTTNNGVLLYKRRYYLSPNSSLIDDLLHDFHCSKMGGHTGPKRTLVKLASIFYWPHMRRTVDEYVSSCLTCQQTKYITKAPAGLLQPLPIPEQVWNELTMDFIVGLPVSHGFSSIMVVVDRLTKFAHFGALPAKFNSIRVAHLFIDIVVKLHGFPSILISDRDPVFMSKFWEKLFELSGSKLKHSTAYHPQTDGQSEVVNRGLEQYLRAFAMEKPITWFDFLSWAEFCYNTSHNESIGMTPFQALYGRAPPIIPRYTPNSTDIQALDSLLTECDNIMHVLKESLRQAQHRMVQKANKHRREVVFQEGDLVLLKLQSFRQNSVAHRQSFKLAKRYFGPFRVLERVGHVSYKLDLPPGARIHPVFHVSLLKTFKGPVKESPPTLPADLLEECPNSPITVCGTRRILRHGRLEPQVLVHWPGSSQDDVSWMDKRTLDEMLPNLHLEDKVPIEAGESDTAETDPVNTRRSSRTKKLPARFEDYIM